MNNEPIKLIERSTLFDLTQRAGAVHTDCYTIYTWYTWYTVYTWYCLSLCNRFMKLLVNTISGILLIRKPKEVTEAISVLELVPGTTVGAVTNRSPLLYCLHSFLGEWQTVYSLKGSRNVLDIYPSISLKFSKHFKVGNPQGLSCGCICIYQVYICHILCRHN